MISNATTQAYTIRFSSQSLVDRVSLYNFWWPKTQSSYSFGFYFQMFVITDVILLWRYSCLHSTQLTFPAAEFKSKLRRTYDTHRIVDYTFI